MPIRKTEVIAKAYRLEHVCIYCSGILKFSNVHYEADGVMKYFHQCEKCGAVERLGQKYPIITWEFEDYEG